MATIIERDSSSDSAGVSALAIVLIVCVFVALGVGFAYMNGSFGHTQVIEKNNTTTIEHKITVAPAPTPAPEPAK